MSSQAHGQSPITHSLPRERLALLFLVSLVTAAGNTALQSVMPSIGTALDVADVWISVAYTWSAVLWMVCAPIWARRSDRRGRKAMMAVGLSGFTASFAACGLFLWLGLSGWVAGSTALLLFAAGRTLYGGFGSAAPPAVQAYVASRTSPEERTRALSVIASSFGLGTVIGPALAPLLILPGLGLATPSLAFALLGIAVLIAVRLRLPDDTPAYAARGEVVSEPFVAGSDPQPAEPATDAAAEAAATPPARLTWRDRRMLPWVSAGLLGIHAQAMITGIAGFLILDRLGLRSHPEDGAGPIGLVLMSGAIATLLAQWALIPAFRMGPRASVSWGIALAGIGAVLFAAGQDLHAIALGFAICSLGFGLFRPGFTAGASLAVSRAEQGPAAGVVASINGAAYVVAPPLGVWLYGHSAWTGLAVIELLCLAVLAITVRAMPADRALHQSAER